MRRLSPVVLVLLLAFGLRMARIQARPLWYDEAFALLYASSSPAQMVHGTLTPVADAGAADVHPLLYYFQHIKNLHLPVVLWWNLILPFTGGRHRSSQG